jgi:heterotetrameric sarcosine oxidase delta subunit
MLQIDCPYCGTRDEHEFAYAHEAHIRRPANQDQMSDQEWADYLFMRKNPKGVHYERWMHAKGCRRYFNVARHTVTHEILAVYEMGRPAPNLDKETGR